MATLAGRGSGQTLSFSGGSGARALRATLPEIWPGTCLGIGSHIPKASSDSAGSGSFGGGTGKGRGSHQGGGERHPLLPTLRQSIVLSFLQQDARSTTEWALWLLS